MILTPDKWSSLDEDDRTAARLWCRQHGLELSFIKRIETRQMGRVVLVDAAHLVEPDCRAHWRRDCSRPQDALRTVGMEPNELCEHRTTIKADPPFPRLGSLTKRLASA